VFQCGEGGIKVPIYVIEIEGYIPLRKTIEIEAETEDEAMNMLDAQRELMSSIDTNVMWPSVDRVECVGVKSGGY
jgi:hypothetical protein